MIVGVPAETAPGERRVALVPEAVKTLVGGGFQVVVQAGAGNAAGFDDAAYTVAGARVAERAAVFAADIVVKVQAPRERPGGHEVEELKSGGLLIGFLRPLDDPGLAVRLARQGVTSFAMELVPRITRAQAMDALSSQSNLAGYRAVLLGALSLPKIFPMMVTAAGTIQPARVFVIGAGVAGLQAIATAKRLGAIIEAYDTRPAVREQVESLGARFVELNLDTKDAQDAGGYAKAQTEEFYARQRSELGKRLAQSDVVVTTALVPGQRAPVLIDEAAVRGMRAGSVIVDLAAEQGGNCALCDPEKEVVAHGVHIIPARNLPSDVPTHASQLYARNLVTLLKHLAPKGELNLDMQDEITRGSLLTAQGAIANDRVKALAGNA
ncbi:MAG TPA: Re/Si-specific NAD(P)(+) transhydrogenase subunit alpha [Myxococcota bacterium]|nr:Re/Si-specific NAD(P)(+) transhydrogenase subunit alpha [Myxococcota bacterium]